MNQRKFLARFVLLIACVVALIQPAPSAVAAATFETTSSSSVAASSLPGVRFVHIATANNTSFHVTAIDHPLLNGNPNAIFLVTQNWNPGGVGNTYNNHAIGVYYTGTNWAIFNQDFAAMPVGAAFNVFIPDAGANVFVHTAIGGAGGNIGCSSSHCTYLNHPLLNNNPNAIFLVTQNYEPHAVYNDHAIGVWYDSAQNKWVIFNQDFAAMPANASFNVVVANPTSTAFIHKATGGASGNITDHITYIDHPLLNGNPNAIVLATQNLTPHGVYNNRKVGVYYDSPRKKWAIFNQGGISEPMPANASFNVLVPDARTDVFVQKRSASDAAYTTLINHPLLNNNPNAIFLVTPNWNPGGGSSGVYNDHAINVWYNPLAGKWLIRNQDSANMLLNASFNVLIPPPGVNVFVHKATADSISGHTSTIDYPLLNDKPNAVFLVTQNYNPGGGAVGAFNSHPIGVWYDGSKWRIFNQDLAAMPVGASFNVMVLNDLTALPWSKAAFVHTATSSNIFGNWTDLNHPLSNGTPPAFVFATDNYNPGGVGGTYNNHHTGVWYDSATNPNRWAIFNQDELAMPPNASFNVLVIVRQAYLPLVTK